MNADFQLDLSEKVNALPLSDEDKRRVIDIAFWAMEQAAQPKGPAVEVDRDTDDGELLIDWSPSSRRMLTLSLRADGRLSYAFTWDDEKAHGTVQMPAGVAIPPATLPESMSRDEMLRYYSEYANVVAHEVLSYQKRIRDLEAALMAAGLPDPRGVPASDGAQPKGGA